MHVSKSTSLILHFYVSDSDTIFEFIDKDYHTYYNTHRSLFDTYRFAFQCFLYYTNSNLFKMGSANSNATVLLAVTKFWSFIACLETK